MLFVICFSLDFGWINLQSSKALLQSFSSCAFCSSCWSFTSVCLQLTSPSLEKQSKACSSKDKRSVWGQLKKKKVGQHTAALEGTRKECPAVEVQRWKFSLWKDFPFPPWKCSWQQHASSSLRDCRILWPWLTRQAGSCPGHQAINSCRGAFFLPFLSPGLAVTQQKIGFSQTLTDHLLCGIFEVEVTCASIQHCTLTFPVKVGGGLNLD